VWIYLSIIDPRTVGIPIQSIGGFAFGSTDVMDWLATRSKEDMWGGLGAMRLFMAVQHKEQLNKMLLADNEEKPPIGLPADKNIAKDVFSDWDDYQTKD